MLNLIAKVTLSLVAMFLVFVGTSNAANYRVTVDCNHSSINSTDTGNRITVAFLDGNRNLIRAVSKNGIRRCASSESVFSINTIRVVRYVEFRTNGNDAFYIDEWRLFKDGNRIKWEGRDNGRGWCLSTDPRDATADWKGYVAGGCKSRLRFPVASGTVNPGTTNNYRVTVDCNHTAITSTDTGNTITVSFLDANRNLIRKVSKTGIRNCARNEAGFSINTNRAVRYIEFRTNGNDAYYIDEWRLFRNSRLVRREGVENGSGWCLSTDPGDTAGWRAYIAGGCRTSLRFAVTGGSASTGAKYSVQIDCYHGSLKDTDTANRITVSFLDRNGNAIRRVSKNGVRNCSRSDSVFSINTNRTVRFVVFSTNGNDAFYIDEWRVFRNGILIKHEGRDNGRGWCLSTDPSDASRDWRGYVTGGCRSGIRFSLSQG